MTAWGGCQDQKQQKTRKKQKEDTESATGPYYGTVANKRETFPKKNQKQQKT
jgi:hypothetical protein